MRNFYIISGIRLIELVRKIMTADMNAQIDSFNYEKYNLVEFQEKCRAKVVAEYGCTEGDADVKLAGLFRQASFEVSKPSNIFFSAISVLGTAVFGALAYDGLVAHSLPQSADPVTAVFTAATASILLFAQTVTLYLSGKNQAPALYKQQFENGIPSKSAQGSMEVIASAENFLFKDMENHRAKMAKQTKPSEPALKAA